MRLLLSLSLSYLHNRKRQSLVSILGVMMGVGFFIGIAAMMQGFQQYFIQKIIDISPHIIIKDEYREPPIQPAMLAYKDYVIQLRGLKPKEELRGIRSAERIVSILSKEPGMAVAPILIGQAFLRYGGKDVSTTITGIEPEMERRVSNIERDLVEGRLESLKTSANGIILGTGLAKKIGAVMNAKISVISPAGNVLKMKVVGILSTGISTIDNSEAYALLKKVQILQNKENVINQIRLRLTDITRAETLAASLEQRFQYRTEGWQETNQNVFSIFVIQNGVMYSTVTAILIVSGFGIFNIISTVVNEKVKDIAILKSMGFSESDVRWMFFFQGVIIGIIGMFAGWILGYLIIQLLASIKLSLDQIVRAEGFILYRTPWHYISSGIMAIISSALSAWLPARRAAKFNPVDIIRGAA